MDHDWTEWKKLSGGGKHKNLNCVTGDHYPTGLQTGNSMMHFT